VRLHLFTHGADRQERKVDSFDRKDITVFFLKSDRSIGLQRFDFDFVD
jgi:hypothetical protein